MTRLLTLPITLPLRVVAFQLRLARGAAGVALDLTRDLAGGSPIGREDEAPPPGPTTPATPRSTARDPRHPAHPRPRPARAPAPRAPRGRRPAHARAAGAARRDDRHRRAGRARG